MNKFLWAAATAAILAGCGGVPLFGDIHVAAGTPRQQVLDRMGRPSRIIALPGGGERLQYSFQPYGRAVWMVDVDAGGKVTGAYQALTETNFNRIVYGSWTRDDIEREFGRADLVESVSSWQGPILTYRWSGRDGSDLYSVYLDDRGIVRRAHPGMEQFKTPD